jgi:2-polyprenyl-3-methyl-5-hydroxy-6-metoxy-1,4-benzoquinol methylase
MFLSHRATQAEYFDSPQRSKAEIVQGYAELARINRIFAFADPYQRLMPKLLGRENCQSLSILDLGGGDGSLGTLLTRWAEKKHGWDWRFTNLDINPHALALSQSGTSVTGSALALPFAENSFDVVIGSQMTHHLTTDEELIQHFREAWRVARRAIYITDLHRNVFLYGLIWLILHGGRFAKDFREDGLLSIKRGFRVREIQRLVEKAEIPGTQVWLYYGSRVIVEAKK